MKRIEGQVHGVLGMVEDDRYCIVLTQADRTGELIAAVARLLRRG